MLVLPRQPECVFRGAGNASPQRLVDALAERGVGTAGKLVLDIARIRVDADVVGRVLHLGELGRGGGVVQDHHEHLAARIEGMD
jgi:hypothetical protein